jgi:rhodanese-related sulfurtransferase
MDRRSFLASTTATATALPGCLGGGSESEESDPDAGYPPESADTATPEPRDVDTSSFETLPVGDVEVPLVPVDVAHYWFRDRAARFVDARGERQYEDSHVTGAVLSTARRVENWQESRDDVTTGWDEGGRIVCYCGCPHHLSSLRAGEFMTKGHGDVYAIDEGFFEWRDQGYPVTSADANQQSFHIEGRTDPTDAGGYAWASHTTTDQQEAAPIQADGSYQMTLHFSDLTPTDPVQTPSYGLTAPVAELADSVVTEP